MTTQDTINKYCGKLREDGYNKLLQLADRTIGDIVETGCLRTWPNCPDGASTLIFAAMGIEFNRRVISIDLNPPHIQKAKDALNETGLNGVELIAGDSVWHLGKHDTPVGILMLDSYDHEHKNPIASQRHVVAELGAIWKNLSERCVIAIDDNNNSDGGKPGIAKGFLVERGFKMEQDGYVVVYSRGI